MLTSAPDLHPLVRKLESIVDLTEDERQALLQTPVMVRDLKADQDIVRDGDRPFHCCVILEGFAFRYKLIEGGKRQILSFHIPGDVPDLQSLHLAIMDHNLATLAPSRIGLITHEAVRRLIRMQPRIGEVLWRDTLIDAAVFREWMVNIGQREAYPRLAHLFCELFVRLKAVGLTDHHSYKLPLTQTELGDALGISTVHVNRTLQQLRGNGLITTSDRGITIEDWGGLEKAGQFDPTYLHLRKMAA